MRNNKRTKLYRKLIFLLIIVFLVLFTGCGEGTKFSTDYHPPEITGKIAAPDSLSTNTFFIARVIIEDPAELQVQARFDWGNGTVSQYTDLAPSGSTLEMAYAYQESGIYTIRVSARNSAGMTTGSSTVSHQITIIQEEQASLINDLLIHNNRFFMSTNEPVNLTLSYRRDNFTGLRYKAYSAAVKRSYVDFPLPVESGGYYYEMALRVETAAAVHDTMLTFLAADNQYPMLRVDFIDVRQGDGVLIQTPEGQAIAIDGGYGSRVPGFSSPSYWNGAGYPFMLNYVLNEDIGHFRYLIETHNHMDHWGGLADIRNHGIEYDFYLSPDEPLGFETGDFLSVDSAVSFEILNIDLPPGVSSGSENDRSVVLRVEYGEVAYLFTGDIEASVESYLVNNDFHLSADVLKAGHHGSRTSSNGYFLEAVLDRYARIVTLSFGTGNPYNHPHDVHRFADYEVFGTNQPSESYQGDNFHFNVGDIKTYTDGYIIIVGY
jgi:beta-lactamase superfamily II metal-dependent hydrolase